MKAGTIPIDERKLIISTATTENNYFTIFHQMLQIKEHQFEHFSGSDSE
jgi:hypothetical protein